MKRITIQQARRRRRVVFAVAGVTAFFAIGGLVSLLPGPPADATVCTVEINQNGTWTAVGWDQSEGFPSTCILSARVAPTSR